MHGAVLSLLRNLFTCLAWYCQNFYSWNKINKQCLCDVAW